MSSTKEPRVEEPKQDQTDNGKKTKGRKETKRKVAGDRRTRKPSPDDENNTVMPNKKDKRKIADTDHVSKKKRGKSDRTKSQRGVGQPRKRQGVPKDISCPPLINCFFTTLS